MLADADVGLDISDNDGEDYGARFPDIDPLEGETNPRGDSL